MRRVRDRSLPSKDVIMVRSLLKPVGEQKSNFIVPHRFLIQIYRWNRSSLNHSSWNWSITGVFVEEITFDVGHSRRGIYRDQTGRWLTHAAINVVQMKEEKFVRVTLLERTSETARETERGRERQHYSYTSNDPAMNFHWRCRSVYFFTNDCTISKLTSLLLLLLKSLHNGV